MNKVTISLFTGDFLQMGKSIEQILSAGADGIHIDIMDGQFVPLFGFNDMWLKSAEQSYQLSFDLHFMTFLKEDMLLHYTDLPVKTIWFHIESVKDVTLKKAIDILKSRGISIGLALSPQTEVRVVKPYLPYLDSVLVLCCEPGTQGACFLEGSYERIKELRNMIDCTVYRINLAADGGLDLKRAIRCIENGCNELIIGRSFFAEDDKKGFVESIHRYCKV